MEIALVVAVGENGVIGADGGLPWRLSTDMKYFRAVTMGKPIIMGRRTWESIGKPLEGRLNIVVSRKMDRGVEGVEIAGSLDAALDLARRHEVAPGVVNEACIIGGGQIYAEAMALADRLYVTHVKAAPDGDTHFPVIDGDVWMPVSSEEKEAGERDSADMKIVTYERRASWTEASTRE